MSWVYSMLKMAGKDNLTIGELELVIVPIFYLLENLRKLVIRLLDIEGSTCLLQQSTHSR